MFFINLTKLNLIPNLTKTLKIVKLYSSTAKSQLEAVDMFFLINEPNKGPSNTWALPVIIMHGLFGSKRNWNSISKLLKDKTKPPRKVIDVDARNHGSSPRSDVHSYPHLAEDIKALFKKLKIEKAALLGHSMGGRAVMYFALKYPELVEKLIVVEISPISINPVFSSMIEVLSTVDKVKLPKNDIPITEARKHCDQQLAEHIKDKAMRNFLLLNLAQGPSGSYIWRANIKAIIKNFPENINKFPNTKGLTYSGQTLFVSGEKSDYIRKADTRKIMKLFPDAEFTEIKEAGHWVHIDKPAEFLNVCTEFLNN